MARGLNHVYLVGALARDPELSYTPNGTAVCRITVAGEDVVTGADGQVRNLPWYHQVSLLGKPAETVSEQFKAGSVVMVEGSLEQRQWDDKETGAKKSLTAIKGLRVEGVQRSESDVVRDNGGGYRLQRALNEAVLVGNLGRDVELRYTSSGDAVAGVAIAVSESWKGKDGNWQEKTHWLDLNLWRELAERAAEFKKGDSLMVTGRIKNEQWTDKEGAKRNSTKVEVTRVEGLTRGPAAQNTGSVGATPASGQKAFGASAPANRGNTGSRSSVLDIDEGLNLPPEDEDLPF